MTLGTRPASHEGIAVRSNGGEGKVRKFYLCLHGTQPNLNVGVHRPDHRDAVELGRHDEESADAVQGNVQHVWLLSPYRVHDPHL